MVAGLAVSFCSSAMSLLNQMASCAAEVRETYSASAVDSAMHDCSLLLQLIAYVAYYRGVQFDKLRQLTSYYSCYGYL